MNDDIKKALSIAKIGVMSKPQTAFLANVVCSLPHVLSKEVPTAGTDGKTVLVNPDFFMSLNKEQRAFLLAHEAMHVVYMHMLRREWRDPELYNKAGDYVINNDLLKQGFELIEGSLHDPQYDGMFTEEVYRLLEKLPKPPSSSMDGDVQYQSSNMSTEQQQALENEIRGIVLRAAQTAQMQGQAGSVPGAVQRELDELTKPKLNWKVILRRFMQSLDAHDYTWTKPRKRLLPLGLYLPSLYSEGLSKITFAIDTSGSITAHQFNQFISEVYAVMKQFKPKEIEVMQFDHILQGQDSVRSLHDLQRIKFTGHGGTNPDAALEAFNKSNSMAIIIITDGEFRTPQTKVNRPVFWAVFNNKSFTAPYGKVVHFEM